MTLNRDPQHDAKDAAPAELPGPEPLVITGVGLVTSLGADALSTWAAVREGRIGVGPLTDLESPLSPDPGGGQVAARWAAADPNREPRLLADALAEAVAQAALADGPAASRIQLASGSTLHGMRAAGRFLRSSDPADLRGFLAADVLDRALALLHDESGVRVAGGAITTCSACSSGLASVLLAATLLRTGEADAVIAGGYDPISEYAYAGFNSLRLVAPGAMRPFDDEREGMKIGEGYGVLVIEREVDALARGARVLARLGGEAETADAHHLTQPHPEGDGAARAIEAALLTGGWAPDEIDAIFAHATSTPDNDQAEYQALARSFGEALPRTPVVALKSRLSHTLGGAGAVELILALLAMRDGVLPTTASTRPEQVTFPGLSLSLGHARPTPIRATLNTSLGFGGANACVILQDPAQPARHPAPHVLTRRTVHGEAWITGVGLLAPGVSGLEAWAARLAGWDGPPLGQDSGSVDEADLTTWLNARRVRRMSEYVKVSLAAASMACRHAGADPAEDPAFGATASAMLGTTHGSATYSYDYYRQIVNEGVALANPMLFAEGVPNAAAAHLSLGLRIQGGCQTFIGSRTVGVDALRLARLRVGRGEQSRVIVCAGEEYSPVVNAGYASCGMYRGLETAGLTSTAPQPAGRAHRGFVTGAGSAALLVESPEAARHRGVTTPLGLLVGGAAAWGGGVEPEARLTAMAHAGAQVIRRLGPLDALVGSACGVWTDAAEHAACRDAGVPDSAFTPGLRAVLAETFSVGPLAAIIGYLTGAWPVERGPVGFLASDVFGCVSAVTVARG